MSLRIRFQYPTGYTLGYSIERLSDGLLFDFSTSAFTTTPSVVISNLPEDNSPFLGRYKLTLVPTPPSQFSNGDYVVTVHDMASNNIVVAELGATIFNGDDTTLDPWTVELPGEYQAGSSGSIVGYLLASISSVFHSINPRRPPFPASSTLAAQARIGEK